MISEAVPVRTFVKAGAGTCANVRLFDCRRDRRQNPWNGMANDQNATGSAEHPAVRAEELLVEAWKLDERVRRKTGYYVLERGDLCREQLLDSPEWKQQVREETLLKAGACAPCVQQESKDRPDDAHRDLVFVTARAISETGMNDSGGYAAIYQCRLCGCEVEHTSIDAQGALWSVRPAER
jgi:hypothetical protein